MTAKQEQTLLVPGEIIIRKILSIRKQNVMIDSDLAELYGVTTKRLNEQVKRNINRFPEDFMFELTQEEKDEVVANCDHLHKLKFSPYLPKVFTEHGIMMLANVLTSDRAIAVSIQIIKIFVKMRELVLTHKDILLKLQEIEQKVTDYDNKFLLIFEYIEQFEQVKRQHLEQQNRKRIGFKSED